jgi:hypothetical protein
MTYLLGWSVIPQILVRRERWPGGYRTKGTPLVHPGQEVQPDQPIIRLEKRASFEEVVAHVPRLSLPSIVDAPTNVELSSVNGGNPGSSPVNERNVDGEVLLPAGLRGRVVDLTRRGGVVIESHAAVMQGAIGAGNQVAGILTMWQYTDSSQGESAIPPGALLVYPGPINFAMLRQAMISGVVGVIASSMSTRDFEGFLRTDLLKLIDSVDVEAAQAHLPRMTILLTEGLGTLAMPARAMNLLSQYRGSIALLSGATSVRQGIYPELVISLPLDEVQQQWHPIQPDPTLAIGAPVRVCSGDYEGAIGIVNYLFVYQQLFTSGIRARAARLRLENGSTIVVPVTLIERIG